MRHQPAGGRGGGRPQEVFVPGSGERPRGKGGKSLGQARKKNARGHKHVGWGRDLLPVVKKSQTGPGRDFGHFWARLVGGKIGWEWGGETQGVCWHSGGPIPRGTGG